MAATIDRDDPVTIEHDERAAVAQFLIELDEVGPATRIVTAHGGTIAIPVSLQEVMRQAGEHLAAGDAVAVVPVHRELSTQKAAELLNVSRPYLIQLLEQGDIPFSLVGTHRRIRLDDVLAYRRQRSQQRRAKLREMTQLSQRMGMYDPPETS